MLDCLESSSGVFMNGLLSANPRLKIMDADPNQLQTCSLVFCLLFTKPSSLLFKVLTFPP